MRFDIITIFPEFFAGPLDYGIVRRARESRLVEACIHDLRDFTHDRHRTVDDRPFGGGEGIGEEWEDGGDGGREKVLSFEF